MTQTRDEFLRHLELARADQDQAGISKHTIFPITHRFLAVFGVRLKPPLLQTPMSNFLLFTCTTTLIPFLILRLLFWRSLEYSNLDLALVSMLLGALIGAVIARALQLGFQRHNIKSWEALGSMLDIEKTD
jgi:hypothetical protein